MRYSWRKRVATAVLCGVVAISSVNTSAFAEVTGVDAGTALAEVLAPASGSIVSEAAAGEALGTKLLSFAAEGARVYVDGVRVSDNVEVDASAAVAVTLEARGGYALPAKATLVTNIEDPVLTELSVANGVVTIPAGTLATDGTLNVECTLTGEPVEQDDQAAEVSLGGVEVDAEGNVIEGDDASDAEKNSEHGDDEDLTVSLDELTNAEVEAEIDQLGDGASDLRYSLDISTQVPTTAEGAVASGVSSDGTSAVLTAPEQTYSVVEVEANVENPAFEGYAYVAGAVIKVTAAEGVLPAGTTVEAVQVENEAAAAAVAEAAGGELEATVLFDITLRDAKGNEVQPTEAVNVAVFDAFLGVEASEDAATLVFHLDENAEVTEYVTARQSDVDVQSFDVEHFSTYALALVGSVNSADSISGLGTYASPYIMYQYAYATFKCTSTDPNHQHNFYEGSAPVVGGKSYQLFDVVAQGQFEDGYYCVITSNVNAFTGGSTTANNHQKLYCGDDTNPIHIRVSSAIQGSVYFIYDADLTGVKMGYAAGNLTGDIAPMFNTVTYEARGNKYYGMNFYYYLGVEKNKIMYYYDTFGILTYSGGTYNGVRPLDYTDLLDIGMGVNSSSLSLTLSLSIPQYSAGAYSATEYGYLASGVVNLGTYVFRPQYYMRTMARAAEPTEKIVQETEVVSQDAQLNPGDTVTFKVNITPETFDLSTNADATETKLTKTSVVNVASTGTTNVASSEPITTDNYEATITSSKTDYTLPEFSTLRTKEDPEVTHEHTYQYVITRDDCLAALAKRSNEGEQMTVTLTPSTTTTYESHMRLSGSFVDSSSVSEQTLDPTTVNIAQEHYVTYEVTYKNAPSGVDEKDYPSEIQTIKDYAPDLHGVDNKTPWWKGDVIEFSGYSVGQIVEDKELKGYWVFSGWTYNGAPVTGDLVMGDSDINVTGEWTYVSRSVVYEMSDWTYDGTYHAATKSYAGDETFNTPTTPTSYEYYGWSEEDNDYTESLGSEHPVNAGKYKVVATWDYIVTNEKALDELNKPSAQENAAEDEEGSNSNNGSDSTTNNVDVITKTDTFEIKPVDVAITSGTSEKLYDGYALTSDTITYNGTWIPAEQSQIEAVALGTQTVGNNGTGESLTQNTIVVLPALTEDGDTALTQKVREQLIYQAQVEDGTVDPGVTASPISKLDEDAQAELEAAIAQFENTLANYRITYNHGTLTVKHREGDNLLPLTVVGATPEEPLTYNGKQQTVSGYTANGQAYTTNDAGEDVVAFTLDKALVEAANNGKGGAAGAAAGVYKDYVTPESDSGSSDDLLGDAENSGEGDSDTATAAKPLVWTLMGVSAQGSGKDANAEGDSYAVTISKDDASFKIVDANGLDVTHEFAVDLANGEFVIDPIALTITSKSVTRAYNTATLTAQELEITGGSFVRNEGLDEARIDWTGSEVTRVGKATNWFDIDTAWKGDTKPSNYRITLVYGELEVTSYAEVADRLDAVVTANSKQYNTDGTQKKVTGFTSMDGDYATFTVEATGVTLYVEGLSASATGVEPGTYTVAVTGTPTIWDSKDASNRYNVTDCFNLEYYSGTLRIREKDENGVEFTNRAELSNKTYDGKEYAPTVDVLQEGTTVYYSTVAEAKDNTEHESWTTTVPTFKNVSTTTVYAYGLKDGKKTSVEEMTVVIKKRAVTLASESASKPYDGLALTATTTPKPASGSLGWVASDLEQLEITATGSVKRPEKVENTIVVTARGEFESDEKRQEAYDAVMANYTLTLAPGTLEVTSLAGTSQQIALTIVGSTGQQLVYNGQTQTVNTFTANGALSAANSENVQVATVVATVEDGVVGELGAASDSSASDSDAAAATTIEWQVQGITASGSAKDVKVDDRVAAEDEELDPFDPTYPVEVSYTTGALIVMDEDGYDVSDQFTATLADGSFEITRRPVTITSLSASKTWDLMTLQYKYYSITSGSFASGEGIQKDNIEWTGARTSPGSSSNTFSIDSALNANTKLSNYNITRAYGTLTVNPITEDADKFEVTVKSKSDKQRLESETGSATSAITITGFENEIVVNGVSYIPVTVSRSGFRATLYVTNLTASATGSERGTYPNTISFTKGKTALVYDSMDFNSRVSVGSSVKVSTVEGKLKLYGPKDDILLWTNEFDVTTTDDAGESVTVAGIDGTYYDGEAKTPAVVSKYYPAGTDTPTTIYYTQSEEAAEKAKSIEGMESVTTDTTNWSQTVPTFTDAGTYTFYAVGVREDKDELTADKDSEVAPDSGQENGDGAGGESNGDATRSSRATSDDADDEERVKDGKRYTEVEDFTLTIHKRAVTFTSGDASKTYDGDPIEVPTEVTILAEGEKAFVGNEADQLEVTVGGEFIVPGNYNATISVELKEESSEEDGGDSAALLGRSGTENTASSVDELLKNNYQILKNGGSLTITNRTGDERYTAALIMPEATYAWDETTFKNGYNVGRLYTKHANEGASDELIAIYDGSTTSTKAYIQAENDVWYELSGYYAKFTVSNAGDYDYGDPVANAGIHSSVKGTGAIYQVKANEVVAADGETTVTFTRVSNTAVTSSFNIDLSLGAIHVTQGGGNAITSTPEWIAQNSGASTVAAAQEALNKLNAWSTWTFTGEAAEAIPAATTYKTAAATWWYSIDAVAPEITSEMSEDDIAAAEDAAAEAATWYSWEDMQHLLVTAGDYSLSLKATTANYRDCYAFDLLPVQIVKKTLEVTGEDVTVYDPTASAYDFTYDERGNLLDVDGNVVADSDGNLTAGTITGLPAGPAAIYTPEVSYNGSSQLVKPVIVDESGYVLTEGVDYYIEYEGDTTNVGTVTMHVKSLATGSFNLAFDLTYEIVASANGNLKAQDVYYYTYQGDVYSEPAIVANYGGSNVIYSLNGMEYGTWSEVVAQMVNAGSYALSIKADDANYVAVDGTVIITVEPLDMSDTPEKNVESVELDAPEANTLYVANTQLTYTGEHQEPEVLVVDAYGNELIKGRDYTTSVEAATTARSNSWARGVDEAVEGGTYTLCVNYRGNYAGTSRVVYSINKVAGNEVIAPAGGFTAMTEGDAEPGFSALKAGSTLYYSVDGGAFVSWAEAAKLLTAGTHTVQVKAVNASFEDAVSDVFTVSVTARPVSDTGSSDAATSTVAGATSTGGSTGSSAGGSSSTGRTVQAAGTTTSSNAAAAEATSDAAGTSEAVTVESTASGSTTSESAGATTAEAAEAAVSHATVMYLTYTIIAGMLLTAAYSLTVIKQRLSEAERLSA